MSIRLWWFDKRINIAIPNKNECQRDNGMPNNPDRCFVLISRNSTHDIWFPDVYIDKIKELRNPVYQIPAASMWFYEDHRLFYNQRINFDLSCPMHFEDYPVRQHCKISYRLCFTRILE